MAIGEHLVTFCCPAECVHRAGNAVNDRVAQVSNLSHMVRSLRRNGARHCMFPQQSPHVMSHTHGYAQTHAHSLTHSHIHARTRALIHSRTHSLTHIESLTHSPTLSLPARTHPHSLARALATFVFLVVFSLTR